jgi:protein-disulfide isomerase
MTRPAMLVLPVSLARDHLSGPRDASVTLVEYGDYECPFCVVAHHSVNELRSRMTNRLCFVYRHFPLTNRHPHAQRAAEAAEAAGAQGMFWSMHDTLFRNHEHLGDSHLEAYAQALHLELPRFRADLASHAHLPKVRDDFMSGVRSGVNGTPTFYINGVRYDGSREVGAMLAATQAAADAA